MCRVHPSETSNTNRLLSLKLVGHPPHPDVSTSSTTTKLTVWKRSSMSFQGTDGFTVFDERGRLVFRVDNYSRNIKPSDSAGVVLMDGAGIPLLSFRPRYPQMMKLSMQQPKWNAYTEDEDGNIFRGSRMTSKLFSMRRCTRGRGRGRGRGRSKYNNKNEAEVFMEDQHRGSNNNSSSNSRAADYRIEGCFRNRNCNIIRADTGQVTAKISRKKVNNSTVMLSDEVFSLEIQAGAHPGVPTHVIMAFVVVLDRISISPTLYSPLLCS